MNGREMVEQVKANVEHKSLPILMLTTEEHAALIKRAKAAGAIGLMVRPFDASQLVHTVTHLTNS